MIEGTLYSFDSARVEQDQLAVSSLQSTSASIASVEAQDAASTQPDKAVALVGRSGKSYNALPVAMENLRIRDDKLFLLSVRSNDGEDVMWVGSGLSLVHDQPNRAEFLDVVKSADGAYVIDIEDSAEQSLASWDLSKTHHEWPHAA